MWHELSHVYVLSNDQLIASRAGSPKAWRCTRKPRLPRRIGAIAWTPAPSPPSRTKKLLPIADLDRGFIHPTYPRASDRVVFPGRQDLQLHRRKVGLRQAAGDDPRLRHKMITPEVIEQELQLKPEEFDKQFFAWLEAQDQEAPSTDFEEWQQAVKTASSQDRAKDKKWDDVITRRRRHPRPVHRLRRNRATFTNSWHRLTWPRATRPRPRRSWNVLRQGRRPRSRDARSNCPSSRKKQGTQARGRGDAGTPESDLSRGRTGASDAWASWTWIWATPPAPIREYQAVLAVEAARSGGRAFRAGAGVSCWPTARMRRGRGVSRA